MARDDWEAMAAAIDRVLETGRHRTGPELCDKSLTVMYKIAVGEKLNDNDILWLTAYQLGER